MGNMFSKPDVQQPAPMKEPTPLPIRDDEANRKARMKTYAAASMRSGAESTNLTNRMGDSREAQTRTGSAVLGGG